MPRYGKEQQRKWLDGLLMVVVPLSFICSFIIWQSFLQPRAVSYDEFLAAVRAGHVSEVRITDDELEGILTKEAIN